ncbi:hypothetical protein BJY52DRAFT_1416870 [Lactarius psammicola]|nr:hypothetical protein BJY52DRAFT_1416870 [Lactarius psammicola]
MNSIVFCIRSTRCSRHYKCGVFSSYIQPERLQYLQRHLETMSADKDKTTNTLVTFRSVVLRSEIHPPHVPTPSIHGIQVALRPGCPPDYPPPLPRGTIIWAALDGSSTIDSSSGYYTVRPYAEVLAESRLSAVPTVRLYAHGQTSESFVANVLTGQKRGRSTAALACKKENELSELQAPVKRKVSTVSPSCEARKQKILAYPRALSNQMKLRSCAFPPRAAVITAYRQVSCAESLETDIAQHIFIEEDDRMFVPEDDMQGIMEEISPGTITAIWTPTTEHFIHDTEMKSPRPKFSDTLRAFSALFNKPLNIGSKRPLPRLMSRSVASRRSMKEDVTMRSYEPGAQASSPQTPEKSLEFVEVARGSPESVVRTVIPCPRVCVLCTLELIAGLTISQQAGQPPSLRGSRTKCGLNKTTGSARLRGAGDAKNDTGRKERARRLRPYKAPKSGRAGHLEKAKTSAKKPAATGSRPKAVDLLDSAPLLRAPVPPPLAPLGRAPPPRTAFQEVYGNTLSFAMAPAEDIATKLRERAEAFLGHLGNVLGAPRLPAFDVNAFFSRGRQGDARETYEEETQLPQTAIQKICSGSSLEELFQTTGAAEVLHGPSEQQSPRNMVLSPPVHTPCSSPETPTRRSRNEGAGALVIDLSSDEEEDGCAGGTSLPGSLLDILGGVTRNLGFLRLQ